jgi:hypothetical protein
MKTSILACALLLAGTACKKDDGTTFGFGGNPVPFDTAYYYSSDEGDEGSTDSSSSSDSGGGSGSSDTSDTGEFTIQGTGYSSGDTAYDLQGVDQNGYPWSLHDQYGSPVVLIVGHMYEDDSFHRMMQYLSSVSGVQTVALVGYTADLAVASTADASTYAGQYGLSTVMADPSLSNVNVWSSYNPPKLYLIDDEMEISWTNAGFTAQSQLESKIDQL